MDKKYMKKIWMVGWIKKITEKKYGWLMDKKIRKKQMDGWMDGLKNI